MKSGNRVLNALQGRPVDRPPFICAGGMTSMMTVEAMQQLSADWPRCHHDAKEMSRLAEGVRELTGIENLGVPFCMTVEAEAMGARVNMGTRESEPRVAAYPISRISKWETLSRLSDKQGRIGPVSDAIHITSNRRLPYPVIANLTGPVSLATSLIEPMVLYKAMGKEPALVHEFMQFLCENLIFFGRLMLQAGADVLTVSDPSASGNILGPKGFEAFALPYINQILDALKDHCSPTMVHICGDLKPVFSKLQDLHTRAISIDSATSIAPLLSVLRKDQVIVGNVSTHLLMKGTPRQVERASLTSLKRGVRILSPACGISPHTPLANMQAMAESVRLPLSPISG
ncbi:MAG: methylcobamide--CoM methyltransferase [Proteobacteria bacterium]|nr:methylcobamide--CoM methyltransferase [Pseudomonadota bacterium]MBU1387413.1 methylcobamide--CoM methyltransferase [Pseudomonadota bacterium]MBU1541698.1 methylcobamide--CoM methyltransferase [Pseudomonadota bacterium]MBU2429933.1 methylcobamide--CoM methyltransferase [Pseudomonadota bacterium]MBU2481999.1 methylcobamide--CoM methyltransferase [Pseudomonadota bacterium]